MEAEFLREYFVTRQDFIGIYPAKSIPINGDMENYIQGHLSGKKRIGFYCLNKDSTVRWSVIDQDNHDNDPEKAKYIELFSKQFQKISKDINLPFLTEISKSGDSHIWLFYKTPIQAAKIRSFLKQLIQVVCEKSEIPSSYIRSVEVFPKQDRISNGEMGNFVWIPLFGGKDGIGGGVSDNKTVFTNGDAGYTVEPEIELIDENQIDDITDSLKLDDTCEEEKKTSGETFEKGANLIESGVKKGQRNKSAFEIVRHLKYLGVTKDYMKPILSGWNEKNQPPLSTTELDRVIESVCRIYVPGFNKTDAGNAELLIHLYGKKIRYNHICKDWYIWNGQFWEKDITQKVKNLAIKSARYRKKLAAGIKDKEKSKAYFAFGLQSESKVRVGFCLDMAKIMSPVATVTKDWNSKRYLLQFTNGVLDLKTMSFEPGKPEYMICQSTDYDYDQEATCSTWNRVIDEIMGGNNNLVSFVQRACGYSMTGNTSEQCLFLLHGTGANGKGVLQDVLRWSLGDYAQDSPFSAFEYRYGSSQSNDLARLHSAHLVTSAESGESKRLDEERLKAITGCDPVTARFLYQEYFTYTPKFKLWLAVNSLPRVNDFSFGFWRRIRLIPFDVKFSGEKDDKQLREKLKPEVSGIMNWFLQGYTEWREHGLQPPEEVIQATKDYQNEADVVAEFLGSFIVYGEEFKVKASELYLAFLEWLESEHPKMKITQTLFGRRISQSTGIKSEKVGQFKYYFGFGLKNNEKAPF